MILQLKSSVSDQEVATFHEKAGWFVVSRGQDKFLVLGSQVRSIPPELDGKVSEQWDFDTDIQLASRDFIAETKQITFSNGVTIGGDYTRPAIIAGPCSVESREQLEESASFLSSVGIRFLRGGCYKPRTSPYSFRGLGKEGLTLLAEMREKYGMLIVSEVRDATHVEEVIEHVDIIQIGAKTMYDHGVLTASGRSGKPVLLKRGFGTTVQEFVQAAEFMMAEGNEEIILCERGIRTFEKSTRFTLDLCGVEWIKKHVNLPIVLDPSHAMGYSYGVPALTKACIALGVDGLIIEVHPNPSEALSDAKQQLNHEEFSSLLKDCNVSQ